MTTARVLRPIPALMVTVLAFAMPLFVGAAESTHEGKPLSKQVREQLASVHDKFAACLRSDKAMSECRKEMKTACMEAMKEGGCMDMHTGMPMHDHEQPTK